MPPTKTDYVKHGANDNKVDRNRIVIEGIDEPLAHPRYSDRIKIDPFAKGYMPPYKRKPIVKT
jgi:hypothetical protein